MRQRWPRPLKLIGPIRGQRDWESTVYSDFVVNQEVAECIQEEGLTGVTFQEVQIFDTTGVPVSRPAYELRVWGWGGIAPPESGIRVTEECPFCKFAVFSSYTSKVNVFSVNDWDESDFFIIWPLRRHLMVTDKVRELIHRKRWSGVRVRSLTELPDNLSGTFTPGPVQDWLDETTSLRKSALTK